MYIHSITSKYPHWVYQTSDVIDENKTFEWCKENLGDYGKRWMNAPANHGSILQGTTWYCYPYRFKSLEDAMAFKLRWL